jgi:hypothetical protein
MMVFSRMRSAQCATVLIGAIIASSVPATVSASQSPAALQQSILAAAKAQRSVHYLAVAQIGGIRIGQVGDAALSEGIQRITYSRGGKTGHVTVIVSSNTAYIRGDAFVLVNYMGFKAVAATKYAGVWVLIPHTDSDYLTVAAGVRLASTIDALELPRPSSILPASTIGGQRVIGVTGKLRASSGLTAVASLYARSSGLPLPVREQATGNGARFAQTLSHWNESVRVAVPSSAVPISTTGLE